MWHVCGGCGGKNKIGLGIHGEEGNKQTRLKSADELADVMVSAVVGSESEGMCAKHFHA